MRKGRERKEALYSLLIGTAIVWLPIAAGGDRRRPDPGAWDCERR